MSTNLHTEGWVVSTNSYSSADTGQPLLSVEVVVMQQSGLIWASSYLALVVSGLKLGCSARRVVCTGPYRPTLKLVKEARFLLASSEMGHGLLAGRSRMRTPDFSSFEMHKPAFEMQKPQSKVKSRISLQSVDAVAFTL